MLHFLLLVGYKTTLCQTTTIPYRDLYSDTWVATDNIKRNIPTNETVGNPKNKKDVGMFYFVWHSGDPAQGVIDHTQAYIDGGIPKVWETMHKGNRGYAHFWSEPYFGYYKSDDEWVIRKHAAMLVNAGVDFIFFDNSNSSMYITTEKKILDIYLDIRQKGGKTPQIVFFFGETPLTGYKFIKSVYNDFLKSGKYNELFYQWDGKPLILGNPKLFYATSVSEVKTLLNTPYDNVAQDWWNDIEKNREIVNYFTIRRSWANESGALYKETLGKDTWLWADTYPQAPGYNSDKSVLEQMVVMCGFWANGNGGRSNVSTNPTFKSAKFSSTRPMVNDFEFSLTLNGSSGKGLGFQEHFDYAISKNPSVILVTGWNEWFAGRWASSINGLASGQIIANTYKVDPTKPEYDDYFVDCFNPEFSRDIEPMKDKQGLGFGDNFYYQLAANIRKYKGARAIPKATVQTDINLNIDFSQWNRITPEFRDMIGDTYARNHKAFADFTTYINNSGRNDIITAKVSLNDVHAFFYVETAEAIQLIPNDKGCMNLFIDSDMNPATGWNGYDLLINSYSTTTAVLHKYNGTSWAGYKNVQFTMSGNKMHLVIERSLLNQNGFDFKWSDNSVNASNGLGGVYNDPLNFLDMGDAAPDARFNFRYIPDKIVLSNSAIQENKPVGTVIGNFSTLFGNIGNTYTYTFATGGTDNASFTITGNALKTNAVFNFETKSSYSIKIRTTDQGGLYFEKIFTITINNVEEPTYWDFVSDLEGWNSPNNLTAAAASSVATFSITGTDPFIHSIDNLNITTSENKYVVICMQNQTNSTTAELFWTTYESPSFNSTKRVAIPIIANDTQQRYYIVDLSANPNWTGALKQLRLDPTIAANGSLQVDFIKITGAYPTTAAAIPGTIQAENFNKGGQRNAYNDATPTTNSGNQYRTNEGVDITIHPQEPDNFVVGWTSAGEWMEYIVQIQKETFYNMQAWVSSPVNTARISILLNGEIITPEITIPNTGAYTTYQAVNIVTNKKLAISTHVIRIQSNTAGFNIDKLICTDAVQKQTIALAKGWNLISVSVIDTANGGNAINRIFTGKDVKNVKNADGFWKPNQPEQFNSLQTLEPGKGYLVNMNAAGTIAISGIPCTGEKFFAPTGWQLIGYPCTGVGVGELLFAPTPISNYFNTTNCKMIKNFDGFWVPNGTTNSIQNFEQGKGYWMNR